ncbi:MAG: hypothetical protein ACLQUY_11985 [Ktedonobacterales bacterium]
MEQTQRTVGIFAVVGTVLAVLGGITGNALASFQPLASALESDAWSLPR